MEATRATNPVVGDRQLIKSSINKLRPPSSALPTQQTQNSSGGLKSFLKHANFDLDFNLTASSLPSKENSASQQAPAKAKAEAVSSSSEDEDKVAEPNKLASSSASSKRASSGRVTEQSKEHKLPVHLPAHTLRSSSLSSNTKRTTDDMGGPGVETSRWARAGGGGSSYGSAFGAPRDSGLAVFATPIQHNGTTSQPAILPNGTSHTATPTKATSSTPSAFLATPTQHQSTAPTSLPVRNKENDAPPTNVKSRLALLKAKRDASKQPTDQNNNAVDAKAQTHEKDDRTKASQAIAEAARLKNEHVAQEQAAARADAERIIKQKAESDRLEAERLAKEKAEAEHRAKIQADLDAVLARIVALEEQERDRATEHDENVVNAKAELVELQAFHVTVEGDKLEADKLVQAAKEELGEVQARLTNLRKKIDDVQANIDEAQGLVDDSEKALAVLDTTNTEALKKHKAAVEQLIKDKERLELSLGHPEQFLEDAPVLSTSSTAAPEAPRAKTPEAVEGQPPQAATPSVKVEPHTSAKQVTFEAPTVNGTRKPLATMRSWPTVKARAPSGVRSARLENIPSTNAHHADVTRLVFHGAIHSFRYNLGNSWAEFTFIKAEDCQKYLEATKNGIPWPEDKARIIVTTPCEAETGELDYLQVIIKNGLSRCVRVVDIDPEWKPQALRRIAEQYNRKMERIVNGHDTKGRRICDFRFCKVADAVTFKSQMDKDADFATCHVSYSADPCTSEGIHKGIM